VEEVNGQALRIIDANINRLGEGLRVLEDVARLVLDDAVLSQQLKNMRHEMVKGDLTLNKQLIQARDSEGDVGIDIEVSGEEERKDLPAIVVANSRRVQEALRVMEELAKTTEVNLDSEKFKKARFELYTIEKKLFSRLLSQDKASGEA